MERWVQVYNHSRTGETILRARWCSSFACRLRGLTFRRSLPPGEGLVLVESRESISQSGIHMMAVWMDLGVVWMDAGFKVVDSVCAKPWRVYLPAAPARYTLEGDPAILQQVSIGDVLELVDEA